MIVDAFGYPSMSLDELRDRLVEIVRQKGDAAFSIPAWANVGGLKCPIKSIRLEGDRVVLEVHLDN